MPTSDATGDHRRQCRQPAAQAAAKQVELAVEALGRRTSRLRQNIRGGLFHHSARYVNAAFLPPAGRQQRRGCTDGDAHSVAAYARARYRWRWLASATTRKPSVRHSAESSMFTGNVSIQATSARHQISTNFCAVSTGTLTARRMRPVNEAARLSNPDSLLRIAAASAQPNTAVPRFQTAKGPP